jgi:hypothetical protein
MRFNLGEGLLNRVHIGRMSRQEQKPGASLLQTLRRPRTQGSGPCGCARAGASSWCGWRSHPKHQPVRLLAPARLTVVSPDVALLTPVGAYALRRHQALF